MELIAITGGIGSGKSLAGDILKEQGFTVIDTDDISKKVSAGKTLGLNLLTKEFGIEILDVNKNLDRKKLAAIVFNDKEKLGRLNALIHPLIEEELLRQVKVHENEEFVFVLVPLLFESGWEKRFDRVWLILADEEIRIERASKRDALEREKIISRMKNQINHAEKSKLAHNVLYNNSTIGEFKIQVLECVKTLRGKR